MTDTLELVSTPRQVIEILLPGPMGLRGPDGAPGEGLTSVVAPLILDPDTGELSIDPSGFATGAALAAETAARIADVEQETADRIDAVAAEAALRIADIAAEALARTNAVVAEAGTRAAADLALSNRVTTIEGQALPAAIATEAAARLAGDNALAAVDTALDGRLDVLEAIDPVTQAEGDARYWRLSTDLATQVELTAALDDVAAATTQEIADAVAELLGGATQETLDTIAEIATALGDDPDFAATITAALAGKTSKAANLSDLVDIATARANLALGTAATRNTGVGGANVILGDDARLSDTRAPTAGSVTNASIAAGAAIAISKLAVNVLDRANHTGTQEAVTVSDFAATTRTVVEGFLLAGFGIGLTPGIPLTTLEIAVTDSPLLGGLSLPAALADATAAQVVRGDDSRLAAVAGKLVKANNLSDLTNAGTARGNLGLGSAATHAHGDYEVAGAAAAVQALAALKANNLSDLANAAAARGNLGLGSAAVAAAGDFDAAGAATAAAAASIPKSLVDAKGDVLLGSADNTVERLAVSATPALSLVPDPSVSGGVGWGSPLSIRDRTLLPAGALADTFHRYSALSDIGGLSTGRLTLVAIGLTRGMVLTSISFLSGTTAMVTGTNQWFALYDSARALLKVTADDGATAWAAATVKTLALAGGTYTVTAGGLYYLGIMVKATTVPTVRGIGGNTIPNGLAPIICGTADSALTNPASAPNPAAALATIGPIPYAYVS